MVTNVGGSQALWGNAVSVSRDQTRIVLTLGMAQ